jgi:hypothetical protein
MANDDSLTPRLGRPRQQRIRPAKRYLGRVLAAANLARGGAGKAARKSRFTGSRIGRGAGIGRLLASRDGYRGAGRRRVIVKASIVRLAGKGSSAAAAHLRYLQRDGTTREGDRGALYGRDSDAIDGLPPRSRPSTIRRFPGRVRSSAGWRRMASLTNMPTAII